MSRHRVRNAALALLAVVAVALTARTLPTARQQERPGSGGSGGPGAGDGAGVPPRSTDPLPQLLDLPFLAELVTILAAITALVFLWAVVRHRREFLRVAAAVAVFTVIALVLLQGIPIDPSPTGPTNGSQPIGNVSGGSGSGGTSGTASGPSLVAVAVVVVLGVAVLGTAVAANRYTSESTAAAGNDEDDDRTTAATALGRSAGRAADRIEASAGLDNEVYQAWREMTDDLDVAQPESTTPREFEDAAVAAGMDRSDVQALTDLFERARYDDYSVDETDEQRAVELLRRIEARYAEGES